jgi:hypothetical protein
MAVKRAGGVLTLLDSPGTTRAEDRAAAVVLAGHARDAAELRQWLEICGLLPYGHRPQTNFVPRGPVVTGYRRP